MTGWRWLDPSSDSAEEELEEWWHILRPTYALALRERFVNHWSHVRRHPGAQRH